ncbi:MAG: hypothetical protein IJ702_09950 [Fretibacterium sp.]|nr:hypothetical protein [Fretibacterium sp.]
MLNNLKISGKLYVGFGLVLALFGVAVFLSWVSISAVQKDITFLGQISRSLALANNTNDTVSLIRAGIRDLHYSESNEDAAKLQARFDELKTRIDAMKQLYVAQPRIDTLARTSDLENALRSSSANLEKFIGALRAKQSAVERLDEGFSLMLKLFQEIVNLQYKRAYDEHSEINGAIAVESPDITALSKLTGDLDRKLDRVKGAEDLATYLLITAWHYKAGLEALDMERLSTVAKRIDDLERMTREFADTTKVQDVREKLNALGGTFSTFKTSFAEVVSAFNESEQTFQILLKAGMEMDDVSDVIMETGVTRSVEYIDRNGKALNRSVLLLIALACVAVVAGWLIAFYIARKIRKPLDHMAGLVMRARDGDLSIVRDDFAYKGRDVINTLSDDLSEMFDALRTAISEIHENADASTEKALLMLDDAKKSLEGTDKVLTAVNEAVKLMESNSSALQESNAGTQEMSAASMTSAQAATDCAEFISNVTNVANTAAHAVEEAIENMGILEKKTAESGEKLQGLVESVDKITEFIGVITSIADQTNLLALNAAIEAARAGEAGRGFAVVAESVRKLAEESSRAAENVRGLMGALQDGAKNTKEASDETSSLLVQTVEKGKSAKDALAGAMGEIDKANDRIQNIAAVAQEQAASSREIAGGIDKVTQTTAAIVENLEDIKASMAETEDIAKRTTAVASEQEQLAEGLRDSLAMFKIEAEEDVPAIGQKRLPARH